ncbi:MAG: cbb3-type cytochrome c oxidase subunit I [Nitrospirae bacterium]|nr:cbb3-type cytochrome c oxidase subunit I [Nitrospirota bacterium]
MASDLREGTASRHAFLSSIVWLVIGVTLGFITSIKLAYPDVLSGSALLNFGHIRPVHVHVVIFGWITMAFAGAIYYMTPALCKTRLWSEKLGVWNIWLWNVGLVVAGLTLILGLTSGREYSDMIWPVDLYVIFLIILPMALNCWMTILNRKIQGIYATCWFFGASSLFLLMVFTFSQSVEIFHITGMNEAYLVWWHAHNILGLWITPVSAAMVYYLVPKITGNPLYSHKIAHLHFWSLASFYSTPGAHHLMAAPIPEWLKSFASVSGILILVPAMAFVSNILLTMHGKWRLFVENVPLMWAVTGVLMAIPLNFQGGFQQTRAINWYIHGTHWIVAHAHFALLGMSTFIEVGAIYYAIPKLFGRKLYSRPMAVWHYWMTLIGFAGFWTALTAAGIIQGAAKVYEIPYVDSVVATHPYMVVRMWFGLLIISAQWLFLYNIYKTVTVGEPSTQPVEEYSKA